jgi:hypothetical protein
MLNERQFCSRLKDEREIRLANMKEVNGGVGTESEPRRHRRLPERHEYESRWDIQARQGRYTDTNLFANSGSIRGERGVNSGDLAHTKGRTEARPIISEPCLEEGLDSARRHLTLE